MCQDYLKLWNVIDWIAIGFGFTTLPLDHRSASVLESTRCVSKAPSASAVDAFEKEKEYPFLFLVALPPYLLNL